jgi:hypothetical protein
MPEPTYTLTLTESERTALARVLGLFVQKLTSAPVFVEAAPAVKEYWECQCGVRFYAYDDFTRHIATVHLGVMQSSKHFYGNDEAPSGGTAAARAVLSPPTSQRTDQPSPPAVAPSPTPVEPRDRWARDRKGRETQPSEFNRVDARISKAERADLSDGTPRMKVSWPAPTSGFVSANCFDDRLFPWLAAGAKSGQATTVYIVQAGKYTNVVGVRA